MSNKDWFVSWFDTPYYHKLYKHRDDVEAQKFMDKLVAYLNVAEGASILDLACGKGRHSIYLNGLGYHVTGLDLSEQSIEYAKQFENDRLQFKVHDMRKSMSEKYDIVFNLFTSFGYFETVEEDLKVLTNIKNAVNEYGVAVIDYLNLPFVQNKLIPNEIVTAEGIDFYIKRYLSEGFIVKEISFSDQGENFTFYEKVRAYGLSDFEKLMEKAEINLIEVFGDYQLGKYSASSERLILIFK